MLCRDFCKHWNGGPSWTGEYHPVTQLDALRLCDVLQRSLDCGGLQVSVDNSVYMTASRVPRTSFAHGGAWRLNDHRGCAGRCEGMWKLIGSTIIQSLLTHMWVYTRDLAWAATWSQCQNSTCAAAQGTGTLQHGWDQLKAGMWVTDLCTPLHFHGRCSTSGPKSNITTFSGDMHVSDALPHVPTLWLLVAQVFDATARTMRRQTWVEGWWEVVKWWKWCSLNLCRYTSTLASLRFLWMNPLD